MIHKILLPIFFMGFFACLSAGQDKRRDPPALGLGMKKIATLSNKSIAADLIGKIVEVDGKKWEFGDIRPDFTYVTIQEITPTMTHHNPRKQTYGMIVKVDINAHLC